MTARRPTRSAVLAGAAATLALGARARPARAAAPLRVLRAAVEFSEGAPYAQEQGLFKQAGIDVTIQIVNSGEVAAAAILGGSADIGAANTLSLAVAHDRGIDFAFVAPGSAYVASAPTSALVVAKESPIRGPRDLLGKSVAVIALGDVNTISVQAWLERNGLDAKSVRFIEVPNPQMGAAVERGSVDAAVISSPALTPALQTGRIVAATYSAIADRFMTNAWYAKREWANANRDLVTRYARAVVEAQQWASANPALSARILVADLKLDPALVARMTRATFAPRLDPALTQPMIDLAAKYGRIRQGFSAEALFL